MNGYAWGMWLEGLVTKDEDVLNWLKTESIKGEWAGGKFNGKIDSQFGLFGDTEYFWLLPGWPTIPAKLKHTAGMADLAANEKGLDFWEKVAQMGKGMKFDMCDYVTAAWDENKNPNVDPDKKP